MSQKSVERLKPLATKVVSYLATIKNTLTDYEAIGRFDQGSPELTTVIHQWLTIGIIIGLLLPVRAFLAIASDLIPFFAASAAVFGAAYAIVMSIDPFLLGDQSAEQRERLGKSHDDIKFRILTAVFFSLKACIYILIAKTVLISIYPLTWWEGDGHMPFWLCLIVKPLLAYRVIGFLFCAVPLFTRALWAIRFIDFGQTLRAEASALSRWNLRPPP